MDRFRLFLLPLLAHSLPLVAQHDPGRDSVRLLAKGNVEEALKVAAKPPGRMNSPIDEAEFEFIKLMVSCHQGDGAKAFAHAQQALEKGLPIDRLLAGPRQLLKPLYDAPHSPWFAKRQPVLLHGPLLGSVTDGSAVFWVRTWKESEVQVKVKPTGGKKGQLVEIVADAKTSAERDHTAVIHVKGLGADSAYSYEVIVDGKASGKTDEFRTFPESGSPSSFRIAFGGGAGYTPENERMWTTIAKRDPLSLLLLGDNVYIDDPEHQLTNDYCYYRRQSQPEWRRLVASTSVSAIYDDHDFGINDCVPGPKIDEPAWKLPVWKTFTHNWNNPSYGGGAAQPGCWHDFMIGQVHFIMLDCRFYRDLKGGSMLGPVQKAWLLERLRASPGVFKVLVSSVPWSPGVKPGSKDTWDGFADEREEIFSFIEKQKIDGVLLMAADRHRTDYRKIPRPNGYDLYEVMSSRLTNVHTHGLVKNTKGSEFIMGYNEKCSYGLMEFDTTADDPQVTYTIVNIDDEEVGKNSLKLSNLSFPKGE